MSFIILVVKCINTEFLQKTLITDITYFTHGSCNLKALTRTEGRKTLMGEGGGGGGGGGGGDGGVFANLHALFEKKLVGQNMNM